jgi:hypothetical protein
MADKVYMGIVEEGVCRVYVRHNQSAPFCPLPQRQDLRNHSPAGFAWGYCGSGPAQLALALVADLTGSDETALANYQRFKELFVAKLAQQVGWRATEEDLWAHVHTMIV